MDNRIIFNIETIPDSDILFLCVHRNDIGIATKEDPVPLVAFCSKTSPDSPEEKGFLSTDWSKYSTAIQARSRRRKPLENAVAKMHVAKVRKVSFSVTHAPSPTNQAHAHIHNVDNYPTKPERQKMRRLLSRITQWELFLGD